MHCLRHLPTHAQPTLATVHQALPERSFHIAIIHVLKHVCKAGIATNKAAEPHDVLVFHTRHDSGLILKHVDVASTDPKALLKRNALASPYSCNGCEEHIFTQCFVVEVYLPPINLP